MDEESLLALHAELAEGQLARLAAFTALGGSLLIGPAAGAVGALPFTLAVTTALRLRERPIPEAPSED